MRLPSIFRLRFRSIFSRRKVEEELEEELHYHLERQIQEEIAAGRTSQDARYGALQAIANLEQRKEECRDARRVRFVDDLIQDLLYALRTLAKMPSFTLVALFSLALGIGANTAVFSLINAVLIESLPVRDPQQLLLISGKGSQPISYSLYRYIREHDRAFSGIVTFHAFANWNVSAIGETEPMTGQLVSGNYFRVLGVQAAAGCLLSPEDDETPDGSPVAVISHSLWRRKFGLDQSAIGKKIRIYDRPFTVIGVTPTEFFGTQAGFMPEVTIPLSMQRAVLPIGSFLEESSDAKWLYVMGRLRPDISEQQARIGINVLFQRFLRERMGDRIAAEKRRELTQALELAAGSQGLNQLRKRFSLPLRVLMTVVGLILLIACTNLANLLFARVSARQREIAIRQAIGAKRSRLVRQLLTESVVLACAGGSLGLFFVGYADAVLVRLFAIEIKVSWDPQVLGFCAALCLLTGILFGLAPALRATRADLATPLKRTVRAGGPRGLGRWLVSAQVSFSLVLLVAATLFVRSLRNLERLDTGFNRENVLLMPVDPNFAGYKGARIAELYRELLAKIETLPGVRVASLVVDVPLTKLSWFQLFDSIDQAVKPEQVSVNHVGDRFFETLGIPILKGRDFTAHDDGLAPKVIAISEAVTHHYFPHQDPIGRVTDLGTIVAVVKDVKYGNLRERDQLVIYRPILQEPSSWEGTTIAVRTRTDAKSFAAPVSRAIHEIDPKLSIAPVSTMAQKVSESIRQESLFAALTSVFGALALVLVSIGLYGIVEYTISRRVNEIGIRMALGARRADVIWLMLRDILWLISFGAALGLALGLAVEHWIAGLLFGLSPADPISLVVSILLLVLAGSVAGLLPAWRGSRVDPATALRFE